MFVGFFAGHLGDVAALLCVRFGVSCNRAQDCCIEGVHLVMQF